ANINRMALIRRAPLICCMIRFLSLNCCFESKKIIPYSTHFDYALDAHQTKPINLPVRDFLPFGLQLKDTIIVPNHSCSLDTYIALSSGSARFESDVSGLF